MTKTKISAKHQSFFAFEKERLTSLYNFIKGTKTKDTNKEISPYSLAIKSYKEMDSKCKSVFYKYLLINVFSATVKGLVPITLMHLYNSLQNLISGTQTAILIFISFFGINKITDILGDLFFSQKEYFYMKLIRVNDAMESAKNYIDITNKPRAFFIINNPSTLALTCKRLSSIKLRAIIGFVDHIHEFIIVGISLLSLSHISIIYVSLFTLICLLYVEVSVYLQSIKRHFDQKSEIITSHIHKQNEDVFQNAPIIQDALSREREYKTLCNRHNKLAQAQIKAVYIDKRNKFNLQMFSDLIFSAIVCVYAICDIIKTGNIGRFALITSATNNIRARFSTFSWVYNGFINARNQYIDTKKILETPHALERKTGPQTLTPKDNKITLNNIRFSYPKIKDVTTFGKEVIERGNDVIKGISTTINPGEITVIAGTSGEGKTTLMSLIRHDYDTTSGTIKIGSKNVTSLSDDVINAQIAFIDQNVHFFDQTLLYNLKYFKQNASQEELKKALDSAGLTADISNLKDGINHKIGRDGRALSGGQRQRLALARIFLTDRPIMILDEPTTGLDQVLSFKIMKTLKEKVKNKTILLVTHNPTEIALADRVIIIKNGQIESDGAPLDLIETSPFLKSSITKQDILSKQKLFSKIS